jgi:hypothetical protein
MSLVKISLLSMFTLCLISAQAARFEIVNQCSFTVWPAATPVNKGKQLDSRGQPWSLDIPAGTSSARIWGRTNCHFDGSGSDGCQTGDCAGALDCSSSGKPPLTLAEFTLGSDNFDSINLSVIDGFNIPMQFSSTSSGCNKVLTCKDSNCPDAYHLPGDKRTNTCPVGTNYKIVFCP